MSSDTFIEIKPEIFGVGLLQEELAALVAQLPQEADCASAAEYEEESERTRRRFLGRRDDWPSTSRAAMVATVNLLVDLTEQGWSFRIEGESVLGTQTIDQVVGERRERWRRRLHVRRNEQLRVSSVRAFIRQIETTRFYAGKPVSIFSLMRDGRDLADSVRRTVEAGSVEELSDIIKPYVQFVDSDKRCAHTGIPLMEIWRYFRHTWANPYASVPGRSMSLLVRDAAAPFHPVIGIAAISSAAAKLAVRDEFIGWDEGSVVERLASMSPRQITKWVSTVVDTTLGEIYVSDLVEDDLLPGSRDAGLSKDDIRQLRDESRRCRDQHVRQERAKEHKRLDDGRTWEERARSPLFRSKRTVEIAAIYEARSILSEEISGIPQADIREALASAKVSRAVGVLVRCARKRHLGTSIADLSVCGAVPPYNALMGGKLVAAMAVSPETVAEYRKRYDGVASVIASQMAGREIVRPADLVFVSTSTLYGIRPCQYDRIAVSCEQLGGPRGSSLRFRSLGATRGFGGFQMSTRTAIALEELWFAKTKGKRVNSLFGEGANPRMRALRDGLSLLGLKDDSVLKHGQRRIVFGVSLIENLPDYLLGLEKRPKYLFNRRQSAISSKAIVHWWLERWVQPRITQRLDETIHKMESHTIVRPVTHGARVLLPEDIDEQERFF